MWFRLPHCTPPQHLRLRNLSVPVDTVGRVSRLTLDQLRVATLSRQFPSNAGHDAAAVLELFTRLGPIQSQVPRAPFLAASSRLPGVGYATMVELFESFQLLRASNLRGTVHTCVRSQFGWLDAVARRGHAQRIAGFLKPTRTAPDQLVGEVEAHASADWRARADLVAHGRAWLGAREPELPPADQLTDGLIWGQSGLLRRPPDTRWETRTDTLHRRARSVADELAPGQFEESLAQLVRVHLRAYGPATRQDLAFFFGVRLGPLDAAVGALGDALVRQAGPDGVTYLDLAEPPADSSADPGLRLLGEFDGLLLGFTGRNRNRFCGPEQLAQVWAKANGLFSPVVLNDGRIVATWKTLTRGRRTDLEVRMLVGEIRLSEDLFDDQLRAFSAVLDCPVTELRVLPAP
jgi:hypothetical protein